LPQTITFSEQPLDTVDPVYLCKVNTVSFTGVIVSDGSQPASPALAPDASHAGSVGITFSNAVDFVELDVGSFESLSEAWQLLADRECSRRKEPNVARL